MYTILKADNEPSDISFQSLSEKIKSLILEKKVPWSSIVEVEKARLPMDSSVRNKIPLLESIGTSDVPEISLEDFILQILPATINSECQAYDEDKLIVHGQAADEAVTLISVLLLSHYVKRPNNPPDERVECDPQSETDVLANYQPIYQRGCDSAITVVKALPGSNNDDFGGDNDISNNNPAVGDANDDRNSVDCDRDGNPLVTYISGDDDDGKLQRSMAKTTSDCNKSQELSKKTKSDQG